MMDDRPFTLVGRSFRPEPPAPRPTGGKNRPALGSAAVLAAIVLCCLCCPVLATRDPGFLDLANASVAPNGVFWFGTDPLGRDIFSMLWYGGRVSLTIGFAAAALSTALGILVGTASALAPEWLDGMIMALTELLMSIPNLLLIVFFQAALGRATVWTIALVVGLTGWTSVAKVVRTQVQQLKDSDYVLASRCMGGGFFHILWWHFIPNLVSSILFMVVMDVRGAIVAESTLSFMGVGLPVEMISWGSMLSLSQRALMTGDWWIVLIPGGFLVATLMCVTNLGNALRKQVNQRHSNL